MGFKMTLEKKAYCPTCGVLNVNAEGETEHPEQDRLIAEMLQLGFNTHFTHSCTKSDGSVYVTANHVKQN